MYTSNKNIKLKNMNICEQIMGQFKGDKGGNETL